MPRMVLVQEGKLIQALAPVVPSSATPRRISLKDISHVTIILSVKNATTVTGSDITLTQSQDVSGTGEKTLSFSKVFLNNDTAVSDALVDTAVVSDTFTLDNTDSKDILAIIEIDANELDTNNDFDVLKVGIGDSTAQTVEATYVCTGIRYPQELTPSAIVD